MSTSVERVRDFINELNLQIVRVDSDEELFVVDDEPNGIKNLIIDCEDPILIIEQAVFELSEKAAQSAEVLQRLLQMNRDLVHGAFVLDQGGRHVIYRDTLQLANLDFNELEGTINALSLGMAEFGSEILEMAKI